MIVSLRWKLVSSFFLLVLLTVGIFAFLTNSYIDRQFNVYLMNRQKQYANELRRMLSEFYAREGSFDKRTGYFTFRGGIKDGYQILIRDKNGLLVWDPEKDHIEARRKEHFHHEPHEMVLPFKPREIYMVNTYPIYYQNEEVAYLEIGYLHKENMSLQDLEFLKAVNRSLLFSGLLCLIFAWLLGLWLSKSLVVPIKRLAFKAEQIRLGDRTPIDWQTTSTKELDFLSDTLNNLSSSLEQQEMLRKQLTADLSHELRTPLATLQSHLEALIDGIWEATPDRLESCHQEVLRLSRMIQELRQLNNLEKSDFILEMAELDLFSVLQTIVTNFKSQYEQKGLALELLCPAGLTIVLDQDKFTQIIVNLLSNAWKYTSRGGRVEVKVQKRGDMVDIIISDNGEGIAEKDLPHIFERLYRGDKSRSRDTGGSGIGLAVTKALVEVQGGKITVNSVLGQGSQFIISFPQDK